MKKEAKKATVMAPEITSTLDIKLSKNDVIDMMMEEEETRIEEEIDVTHEAIHANRKLVETAKDALIEVAVKLGDKKRVKQIQIVENSFPIKRKNVQISDYDRIEIGIYQTRNTPGNLRCRLNDHHVAVDLPERMKIELEFEPEEKDQWNRDYAQFYLKIDKDKLKKTKEFSTLSDLKMEEVRLNQKMTNLQDDKSSLAKRSKKAKAKLVKDMLGATAEGQAIMDSLKKYQTALPAAKKGK